MKVNIKHHTRYGMGYEYHEKRYCCPKCGNVIMYDNDVKIFGSRQNYCDQCGEKLEWDDAGKAKMSIQEGR